MGFNSPATENAATCGDMLPGLSRPPCMEPERLSPETNRGSNDDDIKWPGRLHFEEALRLAAAYDGM